jgi:hypothetical protein
VNRADRAAVMPDARCTMSVRKEKRVPAEPFTEISWPDPAVPQQFHLDIMIEDPAAAGQRVLALGATKLDGKNVYADPAGHPLCLIRRPRWAPPIPDHV